MACEDVSEDAGDKRVSSRTRGGVAAGWGIRE